MDERTQAFDMIKAVYEDKVATINGRDYGFTPFTHKERKRVFAFYSLVAKELQKENFSFMDTPKMEEIEKILMDRITYEGVQLSKFEKHFEKYPEDYVQFIVTALPVVSYPFLRGNGIS